MTDLTFIVRLGVVDSQRTEEFNSIDIYMDNKGRLIGLDSYTIANSNDPMYSPYTMEEVLLDGE